MVVNAAEKLSTWGLEVNDQLSRFKQPIAINKLCQAIRSEKAQGRRLVFNNGSELVGVQNVHHTGNTFMYSKMRILLPNSQLVLSDIVEEPERQLLPKRVFVGDREWYVGCITLATTLCDDPSSSIGVVSRDEAEVIKSQSSDAVRQIMAFSILGDPV
jgi:hypothetical protein